MPCADRLPGDPGLLLGGALLGRDPVAVRAPCTDRAVTGRPPRAGVVGAVRAARGGELLTGAEFGGELGVGAALGGELGVGLELGGGVGLGGVLTGGELGVGPLVGGGELGAGLPVLGGELTPGRDPRPDADPEPRPRVEEPGPGCDTPGMLAWPGAAEPVVDWPELGLLRAGLAAWCWVAVGGAAWSYW